MQLGSIHGYNYAISTLSWDISHDSYIDPNLHHQNSEKKKWWPMTTTPKKWQMAMSQYLLIPFLEGWTSIYQLFWCLPGDRVLTHPQITFHPLFSTPHLDVEAAARDTAGATGYRGPAAAACAVAGVARLAWPHRFSWISSICYTIYIYIYIYTMYLYIYTYYMLYIYTYYIIYVWMYLSVYVSSYLNSCWWSQWYSSTWILTVGKVNAFYVAVGQI